MNQAQRLTESRQTQLANSLLWEVLKQIGQDKAVWGKMQADDDAAVIDRAIDAGAIIREHGITTCVDCGIDVPPGKTDPQLWKLGWEIYPLGSGQKQVRACPLCSASRH